MHRVIYLISIIIGLFFLFASFSVLHAKEQRFISIESHIGFAGKKDLYIGGRVYNYDGLSGIKTPYAFQPALVLNFMGEKIAFNPDSEGFFWINVQIKQEDKLSCNINDINYTSVSLDKEQKRKNKNLVLVTNYGLNTDKINIPFLCYDRNSKFGIITDFDDTLTVPHGIALMDIFNINPSKLTIRNNIPEVYNHLSSNINPIFYVTARSTGNYKVLEEFIKNNNLPTGPILSRKLSLWFIGKDSNVVEHKINAIESIMDTFSGLKFIFIGDDNKKDEYIYKKMGEKYHNRIIKIFIFNNKKRTSQNEEDSLIKYVEKPDEILKVMENLHSE